MEVYSQLVSAQLEVLAAHPTAIVSRVYFNSVDNMPYYYNGTKWEVFTSIKNKVDAIVDPVIGNDDSENYEIGSIWYNTVNGQIFMCVSAATGAAVWVPVETRKNDYNALVAPTNLTDSSLGFSVGSKIVVPSTQTIYFCVQDTVGDAIWSEGGGGLGSSDIYFLENFKVTVAADLTTGNNATPFAGGALVGTLTDEEVAPMRGKRNLKYTQAAGSLNDYFFLPNIAIDPKQAGNYSGLTSYIKNSGTKDDLKAVIWDVTNGVPLTSDLELVPVASNPTRFILANGFYIPEGVTTIALGFHVVSENIGAVFEIDDIELSTNPFRNGDVIRTESFLATERAGYGSTNTKVPYFTNVRDDSLSETLSYTNDSTHGLQFTALKRVAITATFTRWAADGVSEYAALTRNIVGAITATASSYDNTDNALHSVYMYDGAAGVTPTTTASFILEAGETFQPHVENATSYTDNGWSFNLTATAQNAVVLTPSESAETVSKNLLTDITTTSTDIADLRMDMVVGQKYFLNFQALIVQSSGNNGDVRIYDGATVIARVRYDPSSSGSGRAVSSAVRIFTAQTDTLTVDFGAGAGSELQGNDSTDETYIQLTNLTAQFLSSVPRNKLVTISDVKASGVSGGTFTSGAWRTRDLNTLDGDTELIELVSNQFRYRSTGTYIISARSPAYATNEHQCRIHNTTTLGNIYGSSALNSAAGASQTDSIISEKIVEITDTSNLYELQHYAINSTSTDGFGVDCSNGEVEVYAEIVIEKLR